ncbi:MAG: hypothetical protein HY704_17425 [Gemmatimonadetes bacterium]|nr:hypothetical protein [Gemmatimonadota bacterium]
MGEWSYVTAAYGLTWAVLLGYAAYVRARARRARALFESAQAAVRGGP